MFKYKSTKIIELGSCCFRQPKAESHCRFLHGYNLYTKFWFESDKLDNNNSVVDFGVFKKLKDKGLKEIFDHKTIIDKNDPYIKQFEKLHNDKVIELVILDGVVIEKFAKLCYTLANNYIIDITSNRCRVSKVEVFEHEKNSAIYEEVI